LCHGFRFLIDHYLDLPGQISLSASFASPDPGSADPFSSVSYLPGAGVKVPGGSVLLQWGRVLF